MKIILFLSLLYLIISSTEKVCRDTEGNPVDWYVVFFMPKSISSDKEIHFGYYDPNQSELKYFKYEENIFPPTKITAYVTNGGSDYNFFFWNDDLTTKDGDSKSASSYRAHAKGSLVYDKSDGVFLLHSLPRFPTRTEKNEILTELPSNAGSYGQTFLCISIDKTTAEKIAELLNYINVSNNASVKSDRVNSSPNIWITKLISNVFDKNYPKELETIIKSKNGVSFNFISKNYLNQVIPYDTTIRQIYYDDFLVRSWTRPSLAPAICEEYSLLNIEYVKYGIYGYAKGSEHSKWAISKNKNIVCFGDINHTESQANRGGNIVCFENDILHQIMINAVQSTDTCPELNEENKEDDTPKENENGNTIINDNSSSQKQSVKYLLNILLFTLVIIL